MVRVYYELTLWDEVEEKDTEKLKGKFMEMGKRFQGYGVLRFNMTAAPEATQQQVEQVEDAASQSGLTDVADEEYYEEEPQQSQKGEDVIDE